MSGVKNSREECRSILVTMGNTWCSSCCHRNGVGRRSGGTGGDFAIKQQQKMVLEKPFTEPSPGNTRTNKVRCQKRTTLRVSTSTYRVRESQWRYSDISGVALQVEASNQAWGRPLIIYCQYGVHVEDEKERASKRACSRIKESCND